MPIDLGEVKKTLANVQQLAGTSSSTAASSAISELCKVVVMLAIAVVALEETVDGWIDLEEQDQEDKEDE